MVEVKSPILSVVVSTFNRSWLLATCLESLAKQSLNPELFEVLVINNNSTDDTDGVVGGFLEVMKNLKLVHEPIQGLSNARNRGWREASGRYVAYLDDDARADSFWCEKILAAFLSSKTSVLAVGGKVRPWYECAPPAWFDEHFELRSWGEKPCFLDPSCARSGFSGSNFAVSKELFFKYGGFSDKLGMCGTKIGGGEESEFFARVYDGEGTDARFWYDPNLFVWHWTPKRNMTVLYRMNRGFRFGQSVGLNRSNKRSLLIYLLRWPYVVCKFFGGMPGVLLAANGERATKIVLLLQQIAWEVGYQLKR